MAERWRRGRCDVALFPARVAVTAANAASLWREPYLLAAASNHLVATRDRWSVKDLADTPFILRAACEAHDEATRLVAAEGVRPRAVLRSADEERCAAAVLAGLGVSLMPRSLLRPGMASAEIREVALERRVMLAWRDGPGWRARGGAARYRDGPSVARSNRRARHAARVSRVS